MDKNLLRCLSVFGVISPEDLYFDRYFYGKLLMDFFNIPKHTTVYIIVQNNELDIQYIENETKELFDNWYKNNQNEHMTANIFVSYEHVKHKIIILNPTIIADNIIKSVKYTDENYNLIDIYDNEFAE